MSIYITVDGGTTNTRVNLVVSGAVKASAKISLGARDCRNGADRLRDAIKQEIDSICLHNNLSYSDLTAIIASGMITCEYGLCNLPHLHAPAGIAELHNGMHRVENIFGELDCYFIPGVRTLSDNPLAVDMMRGEETEIVGIAHLSEKGNVYILPGSHSKHVCLDSEGRIQSFKTLMTGEMISSLASGTILSGAIKLDTDGFDGDALLAGYDAAEALGLNEALFKVRIMKNLFSASDRECYSFFLGAVLQGELTNLPSSGASVAVIAGKAELREPTAYIISHRTSVKAVALSDTDCARATAIGAVKVFEFR